MTYKNNFMKSGRIRPGLVSALLIAFLVVFPHYVPLPFYSYAIVCMGVIIFCLKRQHQSLGDIGLKKAGLTGHTWMVSIVSALFWIAFNKWVYYPVITHLFTVPPYTEYDFIRNKPANLLITIIAAWLIGGFYEEIVFRGFIQTKIREWFSHSRYAFWPAALLTSCLFGLYHWQQGIFGIIPSFLGGLLWSWLLWRYKGNLWYPIISHAVYDTIALVMIYFGVIV